MAKITIEIIQELREKTGVGMMDCKKALEEAGGNIEKAIDYLRKKGAKVALKRAGKETKNGLVSAYVHPGANLGVLIEVQCETDFTTNTDTLKEFAHDICLHIAAANPVAVDVDELNPSLIEKEKEIYRSQLIDSGKPESVIEKIINGKIKKFYQTACLLKQPFIKNDKITVQEYLNEIVGKINENIKIKRFARFHVGS